jgi:hypothetical protein
MDQSNVPGTGGLPIVTSAKRLAGFVRSGAMCYKDCMRFRARLGSTFIAAAFAVALQVVPPGSWSIPEAQAHSFIEVSIDVLAQRAQRVIVATPADSMSTWESTDGGNRIVTYHRVQVQSDIVGGGDSEVWVRRLGGVVGKVGQLVHGAAPLHTGQTVLLFLSKRQDGTFSVIDMEQGCFPVIKTKDNRFKVGSRRFAHAPVRSMQRERLASTLEGLSIEEATHIIVEAKKRHAK